jgi:hypothetical protein
MVFFVLVFQYMEPQIKLRLGKGLPPENPEQRVECESDIHDPFWDKEFQGYGQLVQILVESKEIEQEMLSKGQPSLIDKAIVKECQLSDTRPANTYSRGPYG